MVVVVVQPLPGSGGVNLQQHVPHRGGGSHRKRGLAVRITLDSLHSFGANGLC